MKLLEYLGISTDILKELIDAGYIDVAHHDQFPLAIFTYGRKAVSDNQWPEPVRKCRGLIVREDTEEIIARPFEKFFNYGDPNSGLIPANDDGSTREPDFIFEKMDGFLCTLYEWEGVKYIASKGSFHSTHAKWATATYRKMEQRACGKLPWPSGYTPVFEGITANLRIVVDYKDREELVLIGLINIETGDEITGRDLLQSAAARDITAPLFSNLSLAESNKLALDPNFKNFEGYVAVWVRPGQTPFRLKIKFLDYLRIHRMVCGVSPKRVYEALVNGWPSEMNEWLDESTPWFSHFVSKWKKVLEGKYNMLELASENAFAHIKAMALIDAQNGTIWTRKQWAERFKPFPEELHAVLFAQLDGKDLKPYIWKRVKPLIAGSHPMVDASKM